MDHGRADGDASPPELCLARRTGRFRKPLAAVVALCVGVLCALVLFGTVTAERASAVAVVAGAGVASVRVILAEQERGGPAGEG
ncbi:MULTISPECIES: hypothetical protein [Streptomyces]|uniref:DUF3040 domain-containing protein n=1 Tax=Streptomyces lycii TaxID=2654337 RepID=A0ABQ7FHY6_9ACTN|nr:MULTISPECIES: hypothetical protein [Streptomyces]KAF4408435.1 hypothetical protein GCU69_14285 [Streptomyces lycii]